MEINQFGIAIMLAGTANIVLGACGALLPRSVRGEFYLALWGATVLAAILIANIPVSSLE